MIGAISVTRNRNNYPGVGSKSTLMEESELQELVNDLQIQVEHLKDSLNGLESRIEDLERRLEEE